MSSTPTINIHPNPKPKIPSITINAPADKVFKFGENNLGGYRFQFSLLFPPTQPKSKLTA